MNLLEKNVGMIDRVIRIVAGWLIIGYSVTTSNMLIQVLGFLIGMIILVTGAVGSCALYTMLGFNTLGAPKKAAPAAKKAKKAK